ncbi:unnamed protein product [Cuscuta europaea]|uniref:N-acetyltransferase domain-containing protein n=1 Tax=Cuscuta europaea TaxID=41803 RepID=A0A9P1ECJ7_CUSEU|nr:unnamed protein product [Cuscuta europaea]
MATTVSTVSCSRFIDPQHPHQSRRHHLADFTSHKDSIFTPKHSHHFPISSNLNSSNPILPLLSATDSPPPSSLSSPTTPRPTGQFLSNEELEKLHLLQNYNYIQELKSGSLWVRVMKPEELDMTVSLLAESFAESMLISMRYLKVLQFFVKQYLIDRRRLMPHAATLVGFYREEDGDGDGDGDGEMRLAGTVEVSFDRRGANTNPPTPTAPKNSPYICNMAVMKSLRRRSIGWHMLKASEELICKMSDTVKVYLHCRMIDVGPYNMYSKAGYGIVKTDSMFVLLMLQRRKHLLCKYLQEDLKCPPSEDVRTLDQLSL